MILIRVLSAWLLLAAACSAAAQTASTGSGQAYPTKPVRLIVPFAPGGPGDIQARIIGAKLTETWGQQVVVENRGGANGIIAYELGARADPDGHTVSLISAGFTINASLYPKLPYDSVRDFAPATQISSGPAIVVVHPSLPARSVKELIALARARPGQIIYMSAGTGAPSHLAVELFKTMTKTDFLHIAYKGIAPGITDLLAGQVQVSFPTILAGLTHSRSGRLRALATTGEKRAPAAPELPTVAEAGVPGYAAANWFGTAVPAKTPPVVVSRLSQEIGRVLRMPDVRERLLSQGMEPVSNTPEEFVGYIKSEMAKWSKVVKASGAKAE